MRMFAKSDTVIVRIYMTSSLIYSNRFYIYTDYTDEIGCIKNKYNT